MPDPGDQREARLAKLRALQEQGNDPFLHTKYQRTHLAARLQEGFDQLEGEAVSVAGRLVALREHGKSAFADLADSSGRVQLFARLDGLGEEEFARFRQLDLGDIIGARGTLMKTRSGEVTVQLGEFTLLAKSLRPLPEKFHGLRDVELRYRQRYLDLITNEQVREIFRGRARMLARLRRSLDERGFVEFSTPVLQPIYGGALARPFTTHHNVLDAQLYMRIAPELYLKRLLVGGFDRVYEIGPAFRNEGVDTRHNPEFTIMEAYQAFADLDDMMELFEGLVVELAEEVCGSTTFTYRGQEINVTPPWPRVPLLEAVERATGINFADLDSDERAREACRNLELDNTEADTWGALLEKCFDAYVQPDLTQPTFVVDYPVALSPLAKRRPDQPDTTYRFEPFIGTEELGNAFAELNDPLDQRRRFEQQLAAREAGDEQAHPLDEDFLMALEYGMPPAGGMGMGVDRLAMLLMDAPNLREVIAFPLLRTPKEPPRPSGEA